MDNNRNMWPIVIGIVAIVGIVAWVSMRHEDNRVAEHNTGVIGNVVEGIGDKIDQASNQAKADANEASANANFDAAKEKLGIEPAEGPAKTNTDVE